MSDIAAKDIDRALALQARACQHVSEWRTADEDYQERNQRLLQDLAALRAWLEQANQEQPAGRLWDSLFCFGEEAFGVDGQELLGALLMEIYPGGGAGTRHHVPRKGSAKHPNHGYGWRGAEAVEPAVWMDRPF